MASTWAELVEKGWALPEVVAPTPRALEQQATQQAIAVLREGARAEVAASPAPPARRRPRLLVERGNARLCAWCRCAEVAVDPDSGQLMPLAKYAYRENRVTFAVFRICKSCEDGLRGFRSSIPTMLRCVLGLLSARQAREPMPLLETARLLGGDVVDE